MRKFIDIVNRHIFGHGYHNQNISTTGQSSGLTMDEAVADNLAKDALRELAKHIEPGEWAAIELANPKLRGVLR